MCEYTQMETPQAQGTLTEKEEMCIVVNEILNLLSKYFQQCPVRSKNRSVESQLTCISLYMQSVHGVLFFQDNDYHQSFEDGNMLDFVYQKYHHLFQNWVIGSKFDKFMHDVIDIDYNINCLNYDRVIFDDYLKVLNSIVSEFKLHIK